MRHADPIAFRARLEPDRPAVYWRGRWISYKELDQGIEFFAAQMLEIGVKPGDRVSILSLNHPVHLHGLYAAARYGWIHAPLNYRLPPLEITAMVEYLGSRALVCGPGFEEHTRAASERLPGLEVVRLEAFTAQSPREEDRKSVASTTSSSNENAVQMLLFTGGTSGTPKAAMISRRMFEANTFDTLSAWGLRPSDCAVQATPMFHAGVNALCTPLLALGARVAILESFTPGGYLHLAREAGATIHFMVPTMFLMLVEHEDFVSFDFSGTRYAITGGSPCPEPVRDAFSTRGVRFKLGYGMTEAGVNCFSIALKDAEQNPASVGFPMPHLEAVIRDENGLEVAPGTVGELTLRGPQVMDGYWDKPQETNETLRHLGKGERWLFTGDLATRDEQGRHFIVGRRKEMFISGGENVFPLEIERALYEHPAVLECAVIGVPDARWGEVGLACIVARDALETEDLRAFLKARLAGYKVPRHVQALESLPKSAAGKVLKNDLARDFLAAQKEESA